MTPQWGNTIHTGPTDYVALKEVVYPREEFWTWRVKPVRVSGGEGDAYTFRHTLIIGQRMYIPEIPAKPYESVTDQSRPTSRVLKGQSILSDFCFRDNRHCDSLQRVQELSLKSQLPPGPLVHWPPGLLAPRSATPWSAGPPGPLPPGPWAPRAADYNNGSEY